MDLDDIKFTEWQIDKIRIAINKYRITNVSNGRMISWSRVRDDITNSDINIDRYFEDDAELAFKPEALRRFAANDSVLELDKLKDLTRFLLHEKILKLEDMSEGDTELRKMLAAHEYLANTSESAKVFLANVAGTYICRQKNFSLEQWDIFTLRIIPDPSREFVRVEEIYEFSSDDLLNYKARKDQVSLTNIRITQTGYGFSVTKDNFLHLFLSGQESGVHIAYVQANRVAFTGPDKRIETYMHLYRHGLRHSIDLWGRPVTEGLDSLFFEDVELAKPSHDST